MIKTKKGLVITAIAVVAVMAGIVSAINFSTPVHGQATHDQDGTCPPPGGCGSTVNPSMPNAPPPLLRFRTIPTAILTANFTLRGNKAQPN